MQPERHVSIRQTIIPHAVPTTPRYWIASDGKEEWFAKTYYSQAIPVSSYLRTEKHWADFICAMQMVSLDVYQAQLARQPHVILLSDEKVVYVLDLQDGTRLSVTETNTPIG